MNKIKFIKLLPLLMLISFQYAQAQQTRTEKICLVKNKFLLMPIMEYKRSGHWKISRSVE